MSSGTGLALPGKNRELRKAEDEQLYGKDLTLKFTMPDGRTITMPAKESHEVGLVRLLLAKQEGLNPAQVQLLLNGQKMLDPMSLCDHPGVAPPDVDIEVKLLS